MLNQDEKFANELAKDASNDECFFDSKNRKRHWFLILYRDRVSGRSTDGRMFVEPCSTINIAKAWIRGFKTHCKMSGETYEIREEI